MAIAENRQSLCERCAAEGFTCCQNTRVFLTLGDVVRIAAAVGHKQFVDYADVQPDADVEDIDPAWAKTFASSRSRRILKHKAEQPRDCVLLTESGCCLPVEARPLLCRLYPFDYTEHTIKGLYPHLCPEPERSNPPLLLALLGMNRDAAEQWRRLLYKEIEIEFE